MANNMEIIPDPKNDSHYVLCGGQAIARFNTVEKAEDFVLLRLALSEEQEQEQGVER